MPAFDGEPFCAKQLIEDDKISKLKPAEVARAEPSKHESGPGHL